MATSFLKPPFLQLNQQIHRAARGSLSAHCKASWRRTAFTTESLERCLGDRGLVVKEAKSVRSSASSRNVSLSARSLSVLTGRTSYSLKGESNSSWSTSNGIASLSKSGTNGIPHGSARRAPRSSAGIASETDVEFSVDVFLEPKTLPSTLELEALMEQLEIDGPLAIAAAMDGLEELDAAESVELSLQLCGDKHMQKLNRKWRDEDKPTDVLSFGQEQPQGLTPILMLGDLVISADTAARQAQERGHSLLDELRVLFVHGLLHLLGHDHEKGPKAEAAMAAEEQRILSSLGWVGQGLIAGSSRDSSNADADADAGADANGDADDGQGGGGLAQGSPSLSGEQMQGGRASFSSDGNASSLGQIEGGTETESGSGAEAEAEAEGGAMRGKGPARRRSTRAPFRYLFCDMDGTLLNSDSKIDASTAEALRAAKARGVTVVIATGKARPAAMAALQSVDLTGPGGVVSLASPGVYIQGLRVYGRDNHVVHSGLLHPQVCLESFEFAREHQLALIGFSGDRCVTLRDHPLVERLHSVYYEPRAEVMCSIEELMQHTPLQKLLFYDTSEGVSNFIRPHWSRAVQGLATVTQAVPDMLEILPLGASKGVGVKLLLDHLDATPDEVMAIGDGENDLEMIEMVGWGVAMANGSPRTLQVADATVASNDEDGVAEAIEKFILS